MSSYQLYIWSILLMLLCGNTACEKADPFIPNEEELITTFKYTLSANGVPPIVLSFIDLDGDGGNAPIINGGVLEGNTTYTGILDLLNEAGNPAESITEEIEEEKEDHQFFFTIDGLDVSVQYNDLDANQQPVGLTTLLTTGNKGTGNLTITLRHEADKNAVGVVGGLLENAGGETDIEVTFPITIQ